MPLVFGYGSLVDRASVEATVGHQLLAGDGPHLARLCGHRRSWNVAGHTDLHPEYTCTLADGTPWAGWIVWLGLEAAPDSSAIGAVCAVSDDDLARLDLRERGYDRVEVSALLDPVPLEPAFTYVPKAAAIEEAHRAEGHGVVMARYLRLVERAYRALGEPAYAEHLASMPARERFTVAEILVAPVVGGGAPEVVDPARG